MGDTYIDIDPDGDTLIILPLVQPANETDDAAWERSSLLNDDNDMDGRSSHSDEDELSGNSSLSSDDGMEDEPSFLAYMLPETLSCYGQASLEIASAIASVSQVFQDNTKSNDTYYFKVSMKQLSLASPRAKAILLGPYRESIPTGDGLRHWEFEPIFDPEAFKIVMSIIHAQFHNVPDEVSLEMLSKIAVIVDDLSCRDSVHHFAKLWLKELDSAAASSHDGIYYARKIFTLWVFSLEERFRIETHHAIMHSPNISSSFGLPIPTQILGKQSLKIINRFKADKA
ncbi:hypothetical protein FP744_10006454 [Trichoderma asperellum]|nr:hypothetical protein LI328DRAFT_167011 [Trichoderma asperelloides]